MESAEENDFLTRNVITASTGAYWIGLSDQVENGKWIWTDGSPLSYTNWGKNQPNNYLGNQDCGQIVKGSLDVGGFSFSDCNDGEWNDFKCDFSFGYVCEKFCP